jgi:hypothetical protein
VPNPLIAGETIPVYNLRPSALGLVDLLDDNSPNNRMYYQGVDVTAAVRWRGGLAERRHIHRAHALGHL